MPSAPLYRCRCRKFDLEACQALHYPNDAGRSVDPTCFSVRQSNAQIASGLHHQLATCALYGQLIAVTQQLQYESDEYHTTAASENIHSPGSHASASPLITAAVTLIQMSSPPQAPRYAGSDHSGLSPLLHNRDTNRWSVFVAHGRLHLMSSLETAVSEPRGNRVFTRDLHRHCGTEGWVVR